MPIWEKNRTLRQERARKIATAKASDKMNPGFPGVVTCSYNTKTNKCKILDGQHRVAAWLMMAQEGHWDMRAQNIPVEVFDVCLDHQEATLFTEINAGEPVRLIDMPLEGISEKGKQIINEAVDLLNKRYPAMFKYSTECRRPHLNAGILLYFSCNVFSSFSAILNLSCRFSSGRFIPS